MRQIPRLDSIENSDTVRVCPGQMPVDRLDVRITDGKVPEVIVGVLRRQTAGMLAHISAADALMEMQTVDVL